jgi:hypothetical protein
MEADLSGQRRPAPSTWGLPLGLGPFPEGPAKVPAKVPPPRATALQCFSSLSGTLGPYFRGKEGNRVRVGNRAREAMKKEGNVPRWSQGPNRLTHHAKPLQCNEFQRWDLAGTLLGPLLSRGGRSRFLLDPRPSMKTCCSAPRPSRICTAEGGEACAVVPVFIGGSDPRRPGAAVALQLQGGAHG